MGKREQRVYDAIKRVRETGDAWVTIGGQRVRLARLEDRDDDFEPPSWALVKRRGRVVLALVSGKVGFRIYDGQGHWLHAKDLLAHVIEIRGRT